MKILSIDVGIKNLAYCLLYVNTEKNTYEIDSWDVIDICTSEKKHTCCLENKGKPCTRDVKYFKGDNYYCKIHSKKSNYIVPSGSYNLKQIRKSKVGSVKEFCNREQIDISSFKKKSDFIKSIEIFFEKKILNKVEPINANNINLVHLGKNMQCIFDDVFGSHTIDIVLIENQISKIANRMKTLQGMIAQYFIMRGVEKIEFISSINKLKPFVNKNKGEKTKMTYRDRKKMGIEVTNSMFQTNHLIKNWYDLFQSHKKKDDLADSFLQGFYYIYSYGIINITLDEE